MGRASRTGPKEYRRDTKGSSQTDRRGHEHVGALGTSGERTDGRIRRTSAPLPGLRRIGVRGRGANRVVGLFRSPTTPVCGSLADFRIAFDPPTTSQNAVWVQ